MQLAATLCVAAFVATVTAAAAQQVTTTAVMAAADSPVDATSKAAASWIDVSSRVGVVAVVLFGCYLLVFSGRLRSDREFKELEATHARELAALTDAHARELQARDTQLADKDQRLAAVIADRDVWRIAAGNALEGLHAFERTTAANLEEKTVVIAAFEALQQIAGTRSGGGTP